MSERCPVSPACYKFNKKQIYKRKYALDPDRLLHILTSSLQNLTAFIHIHFYEDQARLGRPTLA